MEGPTKVVYVGSIPYDQTEEQMLDIFKSVGPVAHIRLVFDKDTGKSKGFGFVEYHDEETASSAVRNLNNYSIGPRSLKVAFSHETPVGGSREVKASSDLPPLPQGAIPPRGVPGTEVVAQALNELSQDKKVQLINDLKAIINTNPAAATDLLRVAPQLSHAIVQTLLGLGLVNPSQINGFLGGSDITPQFNPPIQQLAPPPPPSSTGAPPIDPEQAALIKQVILLTDDQINDLPPDQKDAILALKAKVRSGEIRV